MLPEVFTPHYLHQLELLRIRSRRKFLGTRQGGYLSLKRGHGIEFSDYRAYELGDNPRHIDWGVFARSDRLYVKRFHEEQDLPILLIIDGTASMRVPVEDKKWEMARDLALSLAYIALMQHNPVAVCVPGAFYSPRYSGGRSFHKLASDLDGLPVADPTTMEGGIRKALSRFQHPGIAVFLSDFLFPPERMRSLIDLLRAKNLDISAVQVLGANDLEPLSGQDRAVLVDSETGDEVEIELSSSLRSEYRFFVNRHNEKVRKLMAETGTGYVFVQADEELPRVMIERFAKRGMVG